MNSHFDMVGDFHKKFDLEHFAPTGQVRVPTSDFFLFRFDLIVEEAAEILRAFRKKDLPGVADGIGDLLYVTYGFAQSMNVDIGSGRQYANNVRSQAAWITDALFASKIAVVYDPIARLPRLYSNPPSVISITGSLEDLLDGCYELAASMSIPIDLVYREIQRANMSKVRSTGDGDTRSTRGSKFDVVKPADFVPPRIKEVLDGTV